MHNHTRQTNSCVTKLTEFKLQLSETFKTLSLVSDKQTEAIKATNQAVHHQASHNILGTNL